MDQDNFSNNKIQEENILPQQNQQNTMQQDSQAMDNSQMNTSLSNYDQDIENGENQNLMTGSNPQSQRKLAQKAKKMPWTQEEDKLVYKLVNQYGPQKWTYIAQHIPGRIGKQCRERWHNHLNPEIDKSPWSDEEEWILFLLHRYKGNKWAELCAMLPGRTDNHIKNHWNSSMKKRIQEFINRLKSLKNKEAETYTVSEKFKETEQNIIKALIETSDFDSLQTEPEQIMHQFSSQRRRRKIPQPMKLEENSSILTNSILKQQQQQQNYEGQIKNNQQQSQQQIAVKMESSNNKTENNTENEQNDENADPTKQQQSLKKLQTKQENTSHLPPDHDKENINSEKLSLEKVGRFPPLAKGKPEKIPQKRGRKPKKPLEQLHQLDHPSIPRPLQAQPQGQPQPQPQGRFHHCQSQKAPGIRNMLPSMQGNPMHHPLHAMHHHISHQHQQFPPPPHYFHHQHPYPYPPHYAHQYMYPYEWGMQTPQKVIKENDGKVVRINNTNNGLQTTMPGSSGTQDKQKSFYNADMTTPNKDGVNNLNNNLMFQDNNNTNTNTNNNNNNQNNMTSPKFKYESPSKMLDLGTPDHFRKSNQIETANFLSNSNPRSNFKNINFLNNSGQKMNDMRYLSPCIFTSRPTRDLNNSFMKMYGSDQKNNNNDLSGICKSGVSLFNNN
ncbi:Homeodomain protein [Pseudocohnilembus persalinus]|uniref:Homeodomain protein n=1 Tax=Pseudocohnilembus persalinus TaxID=266149 RepID=A0A0V0QUP0_PSEPJ|nr:Homeodomain protein [Pseudocohnilembus persalinus]|eukprot:KRX05940.1 Homeodomain protein [Pseudocohnilembus persalinus]